LRKLWPKTRKKYLRAVANQRRLSVELVRELILQPLEEWQYALLDEAIEQLEPLHLNEEMEGLTEEEKQWVMATFDRLWDRLGWSRRQLQ
jgi:hypothetical protein